MKLRRVGCFDRLVEETLGVITVRNTAAGNPDLTREGGESDDAAEYLRAALVLVQSPSELNGRRLRCCVFARQFAQFVDRQSATVAERFERMGNDQRAEFCEPVGVTFDEIRGLQACFQDDLGQGKRK